jgi:hypothetical protein
LIHVADGEKQANPLQHLQLVLTPSHPFLVWVLEFATMRSSVRARLAPPNPDSMFSIVSTESHLGLYNFCTTEQTQESQHLS